MSVVASTLSCSIPDAKSDLPRHTAEFHPSIWRDHFLQYAAESKEIEYETGPQIEMLKKDVRKMIVSTISENSLAKVHLIDSVCRLGLSYHFQREIDQVLEQIHKNYVENGEITLEANLHSLALFFRVLRQHGFRVSPNVFNTLKDAQGNFSECLANDVEGMLSLYEATHLRVHGEEILDEALAFTSTHLESIAAKLSPSLAAQVNHSLKQPLHQGLPRLETLHYISIYQQDPSHNEILLTLAKLDFNMLQSLHQKEFGNLCKWWEEFDVPKNLPFMRDRIVECCFWILGVYYEPQYSQARQIMMKVIGMLAIIDDTFDAYGTIDELKLFTEAVERWDISCLDALPNYMKLIYRSLLKVYEETEEDMTKERRAYSVFYGKKEFKRVVQAYMKEATWLNMNYVPTTEEYLEVSIVSCCYPLLTTSSYIGMGDIATEDIFKWVTNDPKIVKSSAVLCRLMDDTVSNQFEQKRGHVASFIECYMKQYGESREDAIRECRKRVINAWKDINEECLSPTQVPFPILMRVLNLSRFMDVIYKDEDNYTHAGGKMKTCIEALLVNPVPI